jgi:2,3-bisphosphoglycerate-dependent phosphoglycerate mutase
MVLSFNHFLMGSIIYLVRHCQATGQQPDAPLTKVGQKQAIALANQLAGVAIGQIISSPLVRAYQSIVPLAERLGLAIKVDEQLVERVLSSVSLDNWQEQLAETFVNLDLNFEGGESSRTAMMRGVAVVKQAIQEATSPVVIVTHGNLMALILKFFDDQIGYTEWANLTNPDVYCLQFVGSEVTITRFFP